MGVFKFTDQSGSLTVQCNGEKDSLAIFGMSERELYTVQESDETRFRDLSYKKQFLPFKLRV